MMKYAIISVTSNSLCGGISFLIIACLSYFFSSRRDLFIRIFVRDKSELAHYNKNLPNETDFKRVLRLFAIVEIIIAAIIVIIGK